MKKLISLTLALLMMLSLVSCGSSGSSEESSQSTSTEATTESATAEEATTEDSDDEPQYGGILRIASSTTVSGVNAGYTPANTSNANIISMCIAYESLLTYDSNGDLVGLLATAWEVDQDEPSITWTLREGVTFSDGEIFNAEAVKRNIEEYQSCSRTEVSNIVSCEVIDDYTIKMVMGTWNSSTLESVGFFVYYVGPDALEDVDALSDSSCGTGPFVVSEVDTGVSIKYVRNENYWQEGLPYLDGVEIYQVSEASTLSSAFQAGEFDIIQVSDLSIAQQINSLSTYVLETNATGIGLNGVGLCPNSADESSPLANTLVRQAICYAIDTEALATAFGYGFLQTTNQWASPSASTYSTDVVGYDYDPDKALELLAEAGYADGFSTTITCDSAYKDSFTSIANMLEEVGIHCEMNIIDTASVAALWISGEWEGMIQHVYAISPDLGLYMGRHLALDGTFITKGIQHPDEAMNLLEAVRSATTDEEKLDLEHQLQVVIYDDYALFGQPLWVQCDPVFKTTSVHDDYYTVNHYTLWSPATCWISG